MSDRLHQIRSAEAASHIEAYTNYELFTPGSWLAKPVKTVLELHPLFAEYTEFKGLDLGCGIGRNCIPLAQYFCSIPCQIDCVDILPLAIDKLNENAKLFHVSDVVNGILSSIDEYRIKHNHYDLILAISALEHVNSKDTFIKKLYDIRNGIRSRGVACLIINTSVLERDKLSGSMISPQFEVNLSTQEMIHLLDEVFSGWKTLNHTIVHQQYDIPRENCISALETDVVTTVFRKT